ncbi:hypothetical protein [Rubrivirga litoralis]|uniref:NTF2-like N-terminal transpeptidase domain-containing protein n=1 Tax=Rubrivirga litoralis TaxID=3075598 RepID=A0ABU3BTL2_9BACT|nr:hypothetical protein [Rubrivirga sp. F394]MDT0632511.1 hypothetical protein [Rubrivirga sp. F394]
MPKIPPAAVAVALAVGFLGGCAATSSDLPTLAAAPTPAVAGPAAPTGDAALDAFLADLAAAIGLHDWAAVAAALDPAATAELGATGRPAPPDEAARALVAEALGLSVPLDAVRVVTLRAAERGPGGAVAVTGDVRRDDGEHRPIAFSVRRGAGGAYYVEVPGR